MKLCKVLGCRYPQYHVTKGHRCGKCKRYGHGQLECGNATKIKILNEINDFMPANRQCTIKGCEYWYLHSKESHNCKLCGKNHSYLQCPRNIKKYKIECPMCRVLNKVLSTQKTTYGVEGKCKVCLDNDIQVFLPKCGHTCLCWECLKILDKDLNKSEYNSLILQEHQIPINILNEVLPILHNKNMVYIKAHGGLGAIWYIRKNTIIEGFFLHPDMYGQYGISHVPYVEEFIIGYQQMAFI